MVEVMGQMTPLFGYYHSHPGLTPYTALEQYVGQLSNVQHMNGQVLAGGQRTPGLPGQFPVSQSPAPHHMQLPGSPHVGGSPAPGAMAAPPMQVSASQQGTVSSGPSANTSPASNKRRRPSAVKAEDDGPMSAPTPGAAGHVNGVKGKPPTPRMAKKAKLTQN